MQDPFFLTPKTFIGLPRGLDFNRVQETFLLIDGNYSHVSYTVLLVSSFFF